MFNDTIRRTSHPIHLPGMSTAQLRETFLVQGLFVPGQLTASFTDLDRLVLGGVMPSVGPVGLSNHKETGRGFFLESREMGIINIGGPGRVTADGEIFHAGILDCVYLPMGTRDVSFFSDDSAAPSKFYFLSCPAHAPHPMRMMKSSEASPVTLGSRESANSRTIYKFIHPGGIRSCQLVMGLTSLDTGSVWNSFPPHTHWRRSEIYLYFDLAGNVVSHFFGEPQETRHLFVHENEAVLSPDWSMHFGCGSGNYKFIWGMAGENQEFNDMDAVKPLDLK